MALPPAEVAHAKSKDKRKKAKEAEETRKALVRGDKLAKLEKLSPKKLAKVKERGERAEKHWSEGLSTAPPPRKAVVRDAR